jgi:perosamine synthetase
MEYLKSKNIGTRVMYPPINKQLAYNETEFFTVSEQIGSKGLWLPSMVQLKDSEINYICSEINNFYS